MVVQNFKCFKNRTVFDFCKTDDELLEQNTCGEILKGALFVGENASGKTVAIQPIKLLLDLLLKDTDVTLLFYTCLFSEERMTSLEYEFDVDGDKVRYSFSFDASMFIEEKLEVGQKVVMERFGKNAKLNLDGSMTLHEVDDSVLFLKQVYFDTKFDGNKVLLSWFDFLEKSIYLDAYARKAFTYNGIILTPENYIEKYGIKELNDFFSENNFKYSIRYEEVTEGRKYRFEKPKEYGKMISFEREGTQTPIPDFLESAGNRILIQILPAILLAVKNGGMLVIDEFGTGLHNKLVELLVKYIMRNGKNVQLFFVSHSTNLLSNSILRPDQIYVVEMEGKEGSMLYRGSDGRT